MQVRLDDSFTTQDNPALFGACRRPGLVGLSPDPDQRRIRLYRRLEGAVVKEEAELPCFLWLSDPFLLGDWSGEPLQRVALQGSNPFSHLIRTTDGEQLRRLSEHVAEKSRTPMNHPDSPQLHLNDPASQYLLATGQTYFNSLAFEDVLPLFVRVYSTEGAEEASKVEAVALRLGLDGPVEVLRDDDPRALLRALTERIARWDPDVLCGFELFKGDLEQLERQAKATRSKLTWGREGERLSQRRARMQVAEKTLDYPRFTVPGRELCDLWILAILHDVSGRELTGFALSDVAEAFGLSVGRPGDPWERRAQADLEALTALYQQLAYPYFLQAQIFPLTFESVMWRGNATRINSLFLREYYRQGHSVPRKPEAMPFAGGLTAQEHEGCAFGVYHCDVASLYPSLMLAYELFPQSDSLRIFGSLLRDLRRFRLEAKERQRGAVDEPERRFFQGLQTTFKILINSFYGYLGFAQGHFADFEQAAEVTRRGRELLQQMIDWLSARGAQILEVDTDGIYFVPSEAFATTDWIRELDATLPEGVDVEFDGRYRGMYCHKMKNYALLQDDGTLLLRGSGLRSRATEPYLRAFMEELIAETLAHGPGQSERILAAHTQRLSDGAIPIEQLAKTETLITNPAAYAKKIEAGGRNRAAVYELALAAPRRYQAGEQLAYYITGDKATVTAYDHCRRLEEFNPEQPDFNRKYYLKKLKDTHKKLAPILDAEPLRSPLAYADLPAPTH